MLGPSSAAQKENVSTFGPTRSTAAANRKWLIAVGIILMLTGIGAIAFPFAGVLAIDRVVATVFTISGLVYLGHSIAARSIRGFAWELVLGILYLLAGLFLFARPIDGVVVLTAVIALSLIADGLIRTAVAITMRRGPWGVVFHQWHHCDHFRSYHLRASCWERSVDDCSPCRTQLARLRHGLRDGRRLCRHQGGNDRTTVGSRQNSIAA